MHRLRLNPAFPLQVSSHSGLGAFRQTNSFSDEHMLPKVRYAPTPWRCVMLVEFVSTAGIHSLAVLRHKSSNGLTLPGGTTCPCILRQKLGVDKISIQNGWETSSTRMIPLSSQTPSLPTINVSTHTDSTQELGTTRTCGTSTTNADEYLIPLSMTRLKTLVRTTLAEALRFRRGI